MKGYSVGRVRLTRNLPPCSVATSVKTMGQIGKRRVGSYSRMTLFSSWQPGELGAEKDLSRGIETILNILGMENLLVLP